MKFENAKIVQKWREYVGPKDERLVAEEGKMYKTGYILLSFGILAILIYGIMAQQVAWVHAGANEPFNLFASPIDMAMLLWVAVVSLVCVGHQTRKGYVDTNRFGQTDAFPLGYFALIAAMTGGASAIIVAAMRCVAELQIVPAQEVFWGADLAVGVVFGVLIFAATLLAFYLSFKSAKASRVKIEESLGDE